MAPVQERVQLFAVPGFPSIRVTKLVDAGELAASHPAQRGEPIAVETDVEIQAPVARLLALAGKTDGMDPAAAAQFKNVATNAYVDTYRLGGIRYIGLESDTQAYCVDGRTSSSSLANDVGDIDEKYVSIDAGEFWSVLVPREGHGNEPILTSASGKLMEVTVRKCDE